MTTLWYRVQRDYMPVREKETNILHLRDKNKKKSKYHYNQTSVRIYHEIDFKNFFKNLQGRSWFLNYLGAPTILIMKKVYVLRLMPVCIGLAMFSCLSVPLITSGV